MCGGTVTMQLFLIVITVTIATGLATSVMVEVDLDMVLHTVDKRFLSVCFESTMAHGWIKHFNYSSTRLHTLLRGLSPAVLRYDGGNLYFKSVPPLEERNRQRHGLSVKKSQLDVLVPVIRALDLRLMLSFDLQFRYGIEWDPHNAVETLNYIRERKYGDVIDFRLGNEPDLFHRKDLFPYKVDLSGKRIAQDYAILHKVLSNYCDLENSTVIGPETASSTDKYFTEFVDNAYHNLTAFSFHHYYFRGQGATVSQFLNSSYFFSFETHIKAAQYAISRCPSPDTPLLLGEGAAGYGGGTPNISDRYVSGFLWLDKLGVAAKYGLKIVMRQDLYGGNYSLLTKDLHPNPDYWLSYVYKQLVAPLVLSVQLKSIVWSPLSQKDIRVYAHCTKASTRYAKGAITIFALNININENATLTLKNDLGKYVDVYLMTPSGQDGLTSKFVSLSGKRLRMVNDETLPPLLPWRQETTDGIVLPFMTYAFFVFPQAGAEACL